MLAGAQRAIGALSRGTRLLAGVLLVAMAAYTLVEIALRLLGRPSNVVVEFVGYGLAGMTFLAASSTMREGGMVRVAILLSRMPAGVRRWLDLFCLACGIATLGTAAWFVAEHMLQSYDRAYETDSLVPLPAWLPPLPLLLGLVAFVLDMLLHVVLVARGEVRLADDSPDIV